MQYNVSHLLREPVGCQWDVEVDEAEAAEPMDGERILRQLRFTRFNEGVWTEAHLSTRFVRLCDWRLRSFRQLVCADFSELCRTAEPEAADLEIGGPFVDGDGVLDMGEVVRQHLIINLPTKLLCNPQCVGICPDCGVYGDKHIHNCRALGQEFSADPRWGEPAALGSTGERGR